MERRSEDTPKVGWGHHLLAALAISFFFCGFPLLLCDVAYSYLWEIRREAMEEDQYARLQARVVKLLSLANPEDLVRPTLNHLIDRATRQPNPAGWLRPRLVRLGAKFPRLLTFTLFDGKRQLVWKSDPRESDHFAKRLLEGVFRVREGSAKNIGFSETPSLAYYLGAKKHFHRLDTIMTGWGETSRFGRKTWFYCKVGERLSLFAHVHREGFSPIIGIQEVLQRAPRDEVFLNLLDMYSMSVSGHGSAEFRREAARIQMQSELETVNRIKAGGRYFGTGLVNSRYRVLASVPDRISGLPEERAHGFRWFALGVFLLVTLVMAAFRRMDPPPWISMRWKMMVLFGFASVLPLAILFFIISAYMKEREALLFHQGRNTSELLLKNLDGQLVRVNRLCESRLQQILERVEVRKPESWNRLMRDLDAFRVRYKTNSIMLLDGKSKDLVIREAGVRENPQLRRFLSSMLTSILNRIRGEEEDPSGKRSGKTGLAMALLFSGDQEDLFEDLINEAGSLLRLQLADMDNFLYYNLVGPKNKVPDYLMAASWNLPELASLYFRRYIPFKPLEDGTETFVVRLDPHLTKFTRPAPPKAGLASPGVPGRQDLQGLPSRIYRNTYPMYPRKNLGRDFRKFFKSFLTNPTPAHHFVEYKGEKYQLSVFPGASLPGYAFFALRPCRPVFEKIGAMRQTIIVFTLLDAGFTLLLGLFLARKFLVPVREMARGVEAMQAEEFHHRISVADRDEFGDLAALFNRLIESRKELTMGKLVQDRLFPKTVLEIGEFRIFGASLPASELGGDYFDYLPYGPDGVLIVQGDATGHGVPAAMIMAMVKALVTHFAVEQAPPQALLNALNRAVFRGGSGVQMMTLGGLFLDSRTGAGTFFNCGNPFPFRIRPGKPLETVRWIGYPLGLRGDFKGKPMTVEFLPGERWMFYSDGLYESLELPTEPGFQRLARFLAARAGLPLSEACHRILADHPAIRPGNSLPDDFTILLVDRNPA